MDDGLIQLLVIGVFVVISVMEGINRKKRRESQALQSPDETEVGFLRSLTGDEQGEPEPSDELVPEESWAEVAELARGGTPPAAEPGPEPIVRIDAGLTRVALPIPQVRDRFEERSRPLPLPVSAGLESVAMTRPEPALLVGTDSRGVALEVAETASFDQVHSSGRTDLEKDKHYSLASGGRSLMSRFFGDRGARVGELRRAVILSEILGPPVSLREPREL